MKRLLCIVSSMNAGGAETFLMKLYRNLDRNKYQMDFIVSVKESGFYDDEIYKMGGKIFYVTPKSKSFLKSFLELKKIVKNEKYNYVLRVNEHSLSTLDLMAARLGGAKVLAMRSSNANSGGCANRILHKLFKFLPKLIPTVKIAPSSEAAIYTFGKKQFKSGKVKLLNNAVPYKDFTYNEDIRKNKRTELNIKNKLVIGHIGRFNQQKNHGFLLDIFKEIKKKTDNAILLLLGKGELETEIKNKVKELKLENDVVFLGVREDIPELLMAMDLYLFPSLYEGMPNTVIEAQATGMKCVVSDTITKEANITGLVKYLPLDISAEEWANFVLSNLDYTRIDQSANFKKSKYDIIDITRSFEKLIFENEK